MPLCCVTLVCNSYSVECSGSTSASLSVPKPRTSALGTLTATDVDSSNAFVVQTNVAGSNGYGSFSINSAGA